MLRDLAFRPPGKGPGTRWRTDEIDWIDGRQVVVHRAAVGRRRKPLDVHDLRALRHAVAIGKTARRCASLSPPACRHPIFRRSIQEATAAALAGRHRNSCGWYVPHRITGRGVRSGRLRPRTGNTLGFIMPVGIPGGMQSSFREIGRHVIFRFRCQGGCRQNTVVQAPEGAAVTLPRL